MNRKSPYLKAAGFVLAAVFVLVSLFREEATTQETGGSLRDAFGTRVLFQNYGTTQLKPLTLCKPC